MRTRTAAVVRLDRLAANIKKTKAMLRPGVELIAVVKADAYGLGAAGIYQTMRDCGVHQYAAAYWEEGAALRAAGASEPILLLADTCDSDLEKIIRCRLTPAIYTVDTAAKLDRLASAADTVQPVQIKIDTGMNRIGFHWGETAVAPVKAVAAMKHLKIEGAFTHFFKADQPDDNTTEIQAERFADTVAQLRAAGVEIPMVHASNSAALILRPQHQLDAVRVGDILYGLITVDEGPWDALGMEEVLTWVSAVAYVKTVPAGETVGYGGTYTTPRDTVVATIPVGYADGYSRRLSNCGVVRIRNRDANIIGRICMDQFMVDVTDIPGVVRGDRVELLGDGVSIRRMSELSGISVDELACGISKRVPRIYVNEAKHDE